MAKYEIAKMLTLSTAHITKETSDLLENLTSDDILNLLATNEVLDTITVYSKGEYGYFIFISSEFTEACLQNFPRDLAGCLQLANHLNCTLLCLDRDGETVEDLKVYEW